MLRIAAGVLLLFSRAGTLPAWAQPGTAAAQQAAPRPQGQNPNGMHIFIWAGLKSHGPGLHDYPQFLADWSKILTERGAVVDGALHPPSAADLDHADVVVIYKGDAGYLSDAEKGVVEAFVKRGGGLVSLHDSLCGPNPAYLAALLGGAKKHGEVNFTLDAPVPYTVVDKSNEIMKDMSEITLWDEAFFRMTWAKDPEIHVLASARIAPTRWSGEHAGEIVPQMWTYEHSLPGGQPSRAFVWMQGHTYANFSNYQVERTLLRGIAWAGKKPVDELVNYVSPPRPAPRGTPSAGNADRRPVRIVLAGDSTVNDKGGWGPGFRASFAANVEVLNLARDGRSSKSYRAEGLWSEVIAASPDYVLLQFGHNDVPGKGPDRETDAATTYRENMIRYVDDARQAGAVPVLVTSIVRRIFDPDGKIVRDSLGPYVEEVRKIAAEKRVALIDLYELTRSQAEELGPAGSLALGRKGADGKKEDTTHLGPLGQATIGAMAAHEFAGVEPAIRPYLRETAPRQDASRAGADPDRQGASALRR